MRPEGRAVVVALIVGAVLLVGVGAAVLATGNQREVATAGPGTAVPTIIRPEPSPTPLATAPSDEITAFASPTGNIGCQITATEARCDIAENDWGDRRPTVPPSCELAYGDAVVVSEADPGGFACHGDTVLGAGPPLPYGESVRVGDLVCTSGEAGVECRNESTRHGFSIARGGYRLF